MATAKDTRIEQLTERVERLEEQVQQMRSQGAANRRTPAATASAPSLESLMVDKASLMRASERLLAQLGIEKREVDIHDLQRRMGEQLPNNELSRGIIEMRDE